jgi:hypothetical protein
MRHTVGQNHKNQHHTITPSNNLLNRLDRNINWGLRGNFLDVPTDCPQRDERLGWTGDAQVFVGLRHGFAARDAARPSLALVRMPRALARFAGCIVGQKRRTSETNNPYDFRKCWVTRRKQRLIAEQLYWTRKTCASCMGGARLNSAAAPDPGTSVWRRNS